MQWCWHPGHLDSATLAGYVPAILTHLSKHCCICMQLDASVTCACTHRGQELDAEAEYDVDGGLDLYESRNKHGHQVSCAPVHGIPAGDQTLHEQFCEELIGWLFLVAQDLASDDGPAWSSCGPAAVGVCSHASHTGVAAAGQSSKEGAVSSDSGC